MKYILSLMSIIVLLCGVIITYGVVSYSMRLASARDVFNNECRDKGATPIQLDVELVCAQVTVLSKFRE